MYGKVRLSQTKRRILLIAPTIGFTLYLVLSYLCRSPEGQLRSNFSSTSTRNVLSQTTLAELTNSYSTVPKVVFVDQPEKTTLPDRPIPLFPHITPPHIDFDWSDERNDDNHHISTIQLLDIEYSYTNQIRDAMINITTEYPYMKNARANGCLFMLARNEDIINAVKSIRAIEHAFNQYYNYPYVFLNDVPFEETFKNAILDTVSSQVEFGVIPKEHWSVPDDIDQVQYDLSLVENHDKYIYGDSKSYRLMCRFNSRFVYKHPLLARYRYYWRIEPNVDYRCPLNQYDPFLFMALSGTTVPDCYVYSTRNLNGSCLGKRYGYVIAGHEHLKTVEGLWDHTIKFMNDESIPMSRFFLESFYNPKAEEKYSGLHFWSNFEIADLEFYRSELYERYVDELDRSGGFFYKRFGDAPVHSIAVAMLLQPHEIHHFADISYFHEGSGTCPKTNNETFAEQSKNCWCERNPSWIEETWWSQELHLAVKNLFKYSDSEDVWI